VLLSFAQFEREVTGERIRDKIAASKKKGMWMGGAVPIGYDSKDRSLVVNEAEAETVRTIFRLYLEHGNVRRVWEEAGRLKLKTKVKVKADGRTVGGNRFFPGHIYSILKCPIYVGRIHHKGETFAGNHAPIIDAETWEAVQAKLAGNRKDRRSYPNAKDASPLVGLLFDANGARFTPTHTTKDGKRYRYYVDQNLTKGIFPAKADRPRIPAMEIENVVRNGFADFLGNSKKLIEALGDRASAAAAARTLKQARTLEADLRAATPSSWMSLIRHVLHKITVGSEAIHLCIARSGLSEILSPAHDRKIGRADDHNDSARANDVYELVIPVCIRSPGGVLKLIVGEGIYRESRGPDQVLCKIIARAHAWMNQFTTGHDDSVQAIAKAEGITASYVSRVLRLAFLDPTIVEAILDGRQPVTLTSDQLTLRKEIPLLWEDQRQQLG
jgi:hypothetical protein